MAALTSHLMDMVKQIDEGEEKEERVKVIKKKEDDGDENKMNETGKERRGKLMNMWKEWKEAQKRRKEKKIREVKKEEDEEEEENEDENVLFPNTPSFLSFAEFQANSVKGPRNINELWMQQLTHIPRVSAFVAQTISERYPPPAVLYNVFFFFSNLFYVLLFRLFNI
jgi:hypothetical protein